MTDVTVLLGTNGLAARVFLDGMELSGLMAFSIERGVIDRVDVSIAPTQLLVIPPPAPKAAPSRKRAVKRKRRQR